MVAELNTRFGIPGRVAVVEGQGGLAKVVVTTEDSTADVYLLGAQVTSWNPRGSGEVLFLSSQSHFAVGKAIRGGIPICFPWFRGKSDDATAPAHGFVRTREWQIEAATEGHDGSVTVEFSTRTDGVSACLWPHDCHVRYRVTVGKTLGLELSVTNTGESPFDFEEALHTYFRVADVRDVRVRGLEGATYLDNMDGNREKVQTGELVLTGPVDDAFMNTQARVEVIDAGAGRTLRTEKVNSATTVVWNPWQEGAKKLPDLADGEWQQMICAEASNIMGATVRLNASETHAMSATISVAP